MVSNKKIHQGFENSYNSYEQYPLEKDFFFFLHHLPKIYFGFNIISTPEIHGQRYAEFRKDSRCPWNFFYRWLLTIDKYCER